MKFVDTDTDPTTFNSSKATLELSNAGENSSSQSCSTVLFAGLYWTENQVQQIPLLHQDKFNQDQNSEY
jgi:hypothetical protein